MKRIIYTVAAAAAVTFGAVGVAAPAMASPNPANTTIQVTTQDQANALMAQGVVNKNIDIPQGDSIQLRWMTINGNVTVEGVLAMASSTVYGNVTASGPGSEVALFNDPGNHITGNLYVHGSSGQYDGGPNTSLGVYSNGQQVDGGLTFVNNTGRAYIGGTMHVNGKFTYGATQHDDLSGLTVSGQTVQG